MILKIWEGMKSAKISEVQFYCTPRIEVKSHGSLTFHVQLMKYIIPAMTSTSKPNFCSEFAATLSTHANLKIVNSKFYQSKHTL